MRCILLNLPLSKLTLIQTSKLQKLQLSCSLYSVYLPNPVYVEGQNNLSSWSGNRPSTFGVPHTSDTADDRTKAASGYRASWEGAKRSQVTSDARRQAPWHGPERSTRRSKPTPLKRLPRLSMRVSPCASSVTNRMMATTRSAWISHQT